MSRTVRRLAAISCAVVAATAVGGGLELITGKPRQQPLEWLEGTWFADYTVPGLLLCVVVGGSSARAALAAGRDRPGWRGATVAAGGILLLWIGTEVAVLNQPQAPTPIEYAYGGIGLAQVALGLTGRDGPR